MFGDPCSEGAAADNNDIERPTALLPPGLRLGEVVAERPWMSLVNEVNSLLFAISPSAGELQASSLPQVHGPFCVGVHTRRRGARRGKCLDYKGKASLAQPFHPAKCFKCHLIPKTVT